MDMKKRITSSFSFDSFERTSSPLALVVLLYVIAGITSFSPPLSPPSLSINRSQAAHFLAGKQPNAETFMTSRDGIDRTQHEQHNRRMFLVRSLLMNTIISTTTISIPSASSASLDSNLLSSSSSSSGLDFRSGGYGREEYTNSFTASRDTNISPKEAYDSINSSFVSEPLKHVPPNRYGRALDVGAGAGVSTQFLWDMGYHQIDAIDWSGDAWRRFVIDDDNGQCPPTVSFFEMDDETFRDRWRRRQRKQKQQQNSNNNNNNDYYDVIVFNFAVNDAKAKSYAAEMLTPQFGRLLAPVNEKNDYWLKQVYRCYDNTGRVLWQAGYVGAWDVQFQPDVTQETCQGIWCPPFNGFQKKPIVMDEE